jgi:uncharacterized protein
MAAAARPDVSAPFFEACARGELIVQGCAACGHRQFYPRRWCLTCDSTDLGWVPVSGNGELTTYTVVRRAPSEAHKARIPYVIGLVRLNEGPQILGTILCDKIDAMAPGMAVRIVPSVGTAAPYFAQVES